MNKQVEMTDEENEAQQAADLEADAEFHSGRAPVCGCEWGCWRCREDDGR